MWHMSWGCPGNTGHQDLTATTSLSLKACAGVVRWPRYWLRGVIPACWVPDLPRPAERQCWLVQPINFPQAFDGQLTPLRDQSFTLLFGDASAGSKRDRLPPHLRRVGGGLAQLDFEGCSGGGIQPTPPAALVGLPPLGPR